MTSPRYGLRCLMVVRAFLRGRRVAYREDTLNRGEPHQWFAARGEETVDE